MNEQPAFHALVHSLPENSRHKISMDPEKATVRDLKEKLRRTIPFLTKYKVRPEAMQLTLEGEVLEEERQLSSYVTGDGDCRPILLSLEEPVVSILCDVCKRSFIRSSDIPRLMSCGHAICLDCLTEGLTRADELFEEKPEWKLTDPILLGEKAAEEQRQMAEKRSTENKQSRREREKAENMLRCVCPFPSCGVTSFWRRDQPEEWPCHDSMHRLRHLRKREKQEGEIFRVKCQIRSCRAGGMFFCKECNDISLCFDHCENSHLAGDLADHEPVCLVGNMEVLPAWRSRSGVLLDRFCCCCGRTGEDVLREGTCVGGGTHCEHGDVAMSAIHDIDRTAMFDKLDQLETLQKSATKQMNALNHVLEQLQEHRVDGVEYIRREFDERIARLQARKEGLERELRRCYREKELAVLDRISTLSKLSGELEAGLVYYHHMLSNTNNKSDRGALKERALIDAEGIQRQLIEIIASVTSSDSASLIAPIYVSFLDTKPLFKELGKIHFELKDQSFLTNIMDSCYGETKDIHLVSERLSFEAREEEFLSACIAGDVGTLRFFLHKAPNFLDFTTSDGGFPLYVAGVNGHGDIVKALLAAGASVNRTAEDGMTSLRIAASIGHSEVVEVLLASGATVDKTDDVGASPLHAASRKGMTVVVQLLLSARADVNLPIKSGEAPLWIAACNGHSEVVEVLLASGACVDKTNNNGEAPLWIAACNGHSEVVEVLLASGACVDKTNNNGEAPLWKAACNGHSEVVEVLLASGACVDKTDNHGASPLHVAAWKDELEVVRLLLAAGSDVNLAFENGETPLWGAACNGHSEVVGVLLASGASVDKADNDDLSPLYVAAANGSLVVVRQLLAAGANADLGNNNGRTPLWIAAWYGQSEVVEVLLASGASVDKTDNDGLTALSVAYSNGHREIASLIIGMQQYD